MARAGFYVRVRRKDLFKEEATAVKRAILASVTATVSLLAVAPGVPADDAGTCFERPATIAGSGVIFGTDGDDIIVGGRASDFIFGGGGNDLVCGGNGDEQIFGDFGADTLDGQNGSDLVVGQGGTDVVHGSNGDDLVIGGPENDSVYGGNGDDVLFGNFGDDLLDGGRGDDKLDGDLPNFPFVDPNPNADTCNGASGSDIAAHCEIVSGVP